MHFNKKEGRHRVFGWGTGSAKKYSIILFGNHDLSRFCLFMAWIVVSIKALIYKVFEMYWVSKNGYLLKGH